MAVRWSVTPFDVIGWSTDGLLALSIAVPPVKIDPAETLSGLADVEAPHLLPLFRRDGAPSPTVVIRRVKAGEGRLCWIIEPMEGIAITAADVLVRRAEVERFERQHGFFNGLHVPDAGGGPASSGSSVSAAGTAVSDTASAPPVWARRLQAEQRVHHVRQTTAQAIKEGDRPGAGANPELDAGEE